MACRALVTVALLAAGGAAAEPVPGAVMEGYLRYHAGCHVCHGADGVGSSLAPALVPVAEYDWFVEVTLNGLKRDGAGGGGLMPAYAADSEVACYLDDLYAYLVAREAGLAPGRPGAALARPEADLARIAACLD
ncbi:MAG: c-type cytochrome [Pseudomonadota bacterium]